MKRVLIAALAFVGLGGGAALAQSLDTQSLSPSYGPAPTTPGTAAPVAPDTSGLDQGASSNPTDSDLPSEPSRTTETPEMPGTGQSGSELPDLGTPSPNLGEPTGQAPSQQQPSSNSQGPTYDEGSTTLPSSPTTQPGISR